jgi:general secretion pathway protein F
MFFDVKVIRAVNDVIAMPFEATDADDAASQAQAQGYDVLSVKARKQWLGRLKTGGIKFSLMLFSQELRALLDAGLTQVEALETMVEKERQPQNRNTMQRIIETLYEGHTLSHALQQFPEIFPPLYIATIHASEKTGDLDEALARYIDYQSRMDVVRKKIVSASIYPMLLLSVGTLVTLFLMFYVVPRFSQVYEDMGTELPFFSRMLMQWGHMLETHVVLAVVLIGGGLAALSYAVTQPAFRQRVMRTLWRIPAAGERIRMYQLARFYRTLGMLLRGGIPIITAIEMVSGLLESSLRTQLAQASEFIRQGQPISHAMETHGLTTPVAMRLLRVGERTGGMGEMTERIANFYDEEMARWVDWFTRLFEPLLMAFIGLVIGVIVILMYFPIFELAGSIQ